jgi:hypothetical protein
MVSIFPFSPFSMELGIVLFYSAFIMLRYIPYFLSLFWNWSYVQILLSNIVHSIFI